ncbi:GIY-YIG nuclease family protein [Methylotenera sp. 1P/1]|uniref:GIY-YIG nuclease family protein n=1 Tax=Methylotenera sp. 1P/1 TaxID=1131551 RepID=UPI0003662C52|nr:GIY-YIG nuclease family protein [Methylotenera sp. 1P/1]
MEESNNYYVYVYIDPRDFTEFYYGKGQGNRRYAHLKDNGSTEKSKIIADINKANLEPIIRVVAKDLTEDQALLVEKTLIWKIGKNLSNIATGAFSNNFRPNKTLYKELHDFDFKNGIYFFNCGDKGKNERHLEDFFNFNFLTAGGGKKYSDAIISFTPGDIACVYLSRKGYVGVCKIISAAVPVDAFKINGVVLSETNTRGVYTRDDGVPENSEYMCHVEWLSKKNPDSALWRAGLYAKQQVKASLQNQEATLLAIKEYFDINLDELIK